MPRYNEVYISQQDFEISLHNGMRYDGFVEGMGYAYTSHFSIPPVHFQKHNPPGRVHHDESFFQNGFIQYIDSSPQMRLMSVKYVHKVKSGDTLTSIAQQYGVSIQAIKDSNSSINWAGERKGDRVLAGEELKLPKAVEKKLTSQEISLPKKINLQERPITQFIEWFQFIEMNKGKNPNNKDWFHVDDLILANTVPRKSFFKQAFGSMRSSGIEGTSRFGDKPVRWYVADSDYVKNRDSNCIYHIEADHPIGTNMYRIRAMFNNECRISIVFYDENLFKHFYNEIYR